MFLFVVRMVFLQNFDLLKSQKERFTKMCKTRANLTSGPGGIERTRHEALISKNESAVAALGASMVTKQAGCVPQRD